jgi:hypothetical protein
MKTNRHDLPPLGLVAAISIVATGCLHHNRTLAPCTTMHGETECWESFRADRDGRLQHHIVERITESTGCDEVEIEQTSFVDGHVVLRVLDTVRCGVVERRIADRYDVGRGVLERVISDDTDRDEIFESSKMVSVPLSTSQRLFAATAGWQRLVRLRDRQGAGEAIATTG